MGFKRRKAKESRTVYVAARISEQSKHYLDVLSLLHQESYSSIVERGIALMASRRAEDGGSLLPDGVKEIEIEETIYGDEEDGEKVLRAPTFKTIEVEEVIDVARESWSPREWLRHLKMFLIAPTLLPATEKLFWSTVHPERNESSYWTTASAEALAALSEHDRNDFGPYVLRLGIPVQDRIETAWNEFRARP